MNNYPNRIKLVLADTNTLLSYGLKAIFSKLDTVILSGHPNSFNSLINLIDTQQPDVIITDSMLSGMDGPETIRTLSNRSKASVILFEEEINPLHFLYYINKSVHSIISRREPIGTLLKSIYAVHRGEYYYCAYVLEYVSNFRTQMAIKSGAM
jgi:DNA-binding NarL/FixJ family response regulator